MLEKLRQWLETFPKWDAALQFDDVDAVPGSSGLYPMGLTELSRRENVLGNVMVRCRETFLLRRVAGQSAENAQWLEDFQNWVMEQDALGLTPKALQRLRKAQAAAPADEAVTGTANPAFAALMTRIQEASHGGTE